MENAVFGPKNMAKTAKFLELLEKIWAEVERVAGVDLSPTVMEAQSYRAPPAFVHERLHAANRAGLFLSQPFVLQKDYEDLANPWRSHRDLSHLAHQVLRFARKDAR